MPTRNRHGYNYDGNKLGLDLIFTVGGMDCSANISQPSERVDHVPTAQEIERQKKYDWPPSRYDYVPANRLRVMIDTNSRFSCRESWTETKTLPLQLRLPDVMMSFERWAIIDAEGKESDRRAEIEKQARLAREEELARQAYVEHTLGEHLLADASDWELVGRLRRYLTEMATRITQITDADDRAAANDWLEWCKTSAATRDPFVPPIRRPNVKDPGYTEIHEFRQRLGFRNSFW